jgi:hypothetical protein
VMIVRDFGTDAQWAAKAEEQQRRLIADSDHTPLLEASTSSQVDAVVSFAPADNRSALCEPQATPVAAAPYFGPPVFNWQSQPVPAPIYAAEPIPSTPVAAPVWRAKA